MIGILPSHVLPNQEAPFCPHETNTYCHEKYIRSAFMNSTYITIALYIISHEINMVVMLFFGVFCDYIIILVKMNLSFSRITWWELGHSYDHMAWWRHQMETFPRYWISVRGIHRWPVNSPHKCQWRWALMFSLICAWINIRVNNCEAGDFRRYGAYYDGTVMGKIE